MKKTIMMGSLVVAALLTTGCVSKQTHEAALLELDQTRSSLSSAEQTIAEQNRQIETNREEIARTQNELSDLDKQKASLQGELEDARSQLGDFKSQLETMRQIEAETKKRNEIYARFVKELQKMIDGGQLTVSIEEGRIVINLPDNVLFASGSAKVNDEGRTALKQIAAVLKAFEDRRFQIEGHTDNVPIKGHSGYSNWELSADRALSVVHLMVEEGVQAQNVSAAGYGEYRPRAENGSDEGRAMNRRIEIIMLPNLEILSNELPKVVQ